MVKKLFAFIGTSPYEETEYFIDIDGKRKSCNSPYIQEALFEVLEQRQLEVVIFATDEARRKNWIPENKVGLKRRLEEKNAAYKIVVIPEGKSNEEIWDIFALVYGEIQENDEIYVDVTHSFRSIPIIFMSVLNHARVTKKCKIERIFYGAYEARKDGLSPVFDLSVFNQISDWNSGVEQLLETGESEKFKEVVEKNIKPILAEKKGTDELIKLTDKCARSITEFYTDLQLVKGQTMLNDGKKLKEVLNELQKYDFSKYKNIQPFYKLLERIKKQVDFFNTGDMIFEILECIKLCKWFGLYQQAYTLLQENIVNYVCLKCGLDCGKYKPDRELAEKLIISRYYNIELSEVEKNILIEKLSDFSVDMAKLHHELTDYRNELNHAQFRRNGPSKNKLVSDLEGFIVRFEDLYVKSSKDVKERVQ